MRVAKNLLQRQLLHQLKFLVQQEKKWTDPIKLGDI